MSTFPWHTKENIERESEKRETLILKCYKFLVVVTYAPAWSRVLCSKQATNGNSKNENKIPDNDSKEKADWRKEQQYVREELLIFSPYKRAEEMPDKLVSATWKVLPLEAFIFLPGGGM
jgi:hypothetical protein